MAKRTDIMYHHFGEVVKTSNYFLGNDGIDIRALKVHYECVRESLEEMKANQTIYNSKKIKVLEDLESRLKKRVDEKEKTKD